MSASLVSRRSLLQLCVVASASWANSVWAGSYLDRAALLVHEANVELAYLRRKLRDKELARVIQELAAGRLRTARDMFVPKEVTQAHPHLLLFLENCERAAGHAAEGRVDGFLKFLQLARDEEQHLRGIIKQLGWELPRLDD